MRLRNRSVDNNGSFPDRSLARMWRKLRGTIRAMTAVWNRNAARQLIAVVISPPISGPAAAAGTA